MVTIVVTSNYPDVVSERTRLKSLFRSYDQERIFHLLTTSRLSRNYARHDRLVRFDLRRTFGAEAAPWNIEIDNDPSRGSIAPGLEHDESFRDLTTQNETGEITNDQDPAFNSTVKENSEQSVYTTADMPNITTVINSSIMSSTASTYSSGGPLRMYESIYTSFTSKSSQSHTVMSSGLSTNPYGARPTIFDNQNPNSLYLHNLPRAHSRMYTPPTNSYIFSTQSNLPGGWGHYSQYLSRNQHISQPIETHPQTQPLPLSIETSHTSPPVNSHPNTARVHFENYPPEGLDPWVNLNKASRIETSQSSYPPQTETQSVMNNVTSSRIENAQPTINRLNPLYPEGAKGYNPQPPLGENMRSSFAGQGPHQQIDSSMGLHPPTDGYPWPYPPMFPPPGYYPPMTYGQAYGQPALPIDYRYTQKYDPRYASLSQPSPGECTTCGSGIFLKF